MEPIGLALTRQPFNPVIILFFVTMAVVVFVVAYRAKAWDEDEDEDDEK